MALPGKARLGAHSREEEPCLDSYECESESLIVHIDFRQRFSSTGCVLARKYTQQGLSNAELLRFFVFLMVGF